MGVDWVVLFLFDSHQSIQVPDPRGFFLSPLRFHALSGSSKFRISHDFHSPSIFYYPYLRIFHGSFFNN